MAELEKMGSGPVKKILEAHGAKEPLFGVKVADLKIIQKKIKKDYTVAKELFATGNYDAQYLAGLIADDAKMTKKDLQQWAESANSSGISEYSVAWAAAESPFGWETGLQWIDSPKERVAAAGWNTLSGVIALKKDEELDMTAINKLLKRIEKDIHNAPNRVRYTMNGFLMSAGIYISSLTKEAVLLAKKIGTVMVDMNGTACKVPSAVDYISKSEARGAIGKKKKTVKC